jgi:hypothetical protein
MKLPEIQTLKKIRDAKICNMLLSGAEKEEISDKVGLSVRQIDRILYKNASVLKKALELTKDQEKVNKILWLKKQIRLSKKFDVDLELQPLTLMDELAKELDENRLGQSGNGNQRVVVIIQEKNGIQSNSREGQIPSRVSILQE